MKNKTIVLLFLLAFSSVAFADITTNIGMQQVQPDSIVDENTDSEPQEIKDSGFVGGITGWFVELFGGVNSGEISFADLLLGAKVIDCPKDQYFFGFDGKGQLKCRVDRAPTKTIYTGTGAISVTDITNIISVDSSALDTNLLGLDNLTQITTRNFEDIDNRNLSLINYDDNSVPDSRYANLTDINFLISANADVVLNTTHRSSDGSDHSFIDQDVTSGSEPNFLVSNFSDGGGNAIITSIQETNFETAYTHSQLTSGNPHNVVVGEVADLNSTIDARIENIDHSIIATGWDFVSTLTFGGGFGSGGSTIDGGTGYFQDITVAGTVTTVNITDVNITGDFEPSIDSSFNLGVIGKEFLNLYVDHVVATDILLSGSTLISSILDEDAFGSNSATALATQQSIKAYVDTQLTAEQFIDHSDTPSTYSAKGSQFLQVNELENALEYVTKQSLANLLFLLQDTDDLSEGSVNLYYTEARVSANTNVTANTTHRTSDGSDHSFIDQDVTSGSAPTFTGANFSSIAYSVLTGTPTIPIDTNIFVNPPSDCSAGEYIYGFNSDGTIDCRTDQSGGGGGGDGNVSSSVESTDNAIPRWSGTGGRTLENTGIRIDDNNNLIIPVDVNIVFGNIGKIGSSSDNNAMFMCSGC